MKKPCMETERERMCRFAEKVGINHFLTLQQSRLMDRLIMDYYKNTATIEKT